MEKLALCYLATACLFLPSSFTPFFTMLHWYINVYIFACIPCSLCFCSTILSAWLLPTEFRKPSLGTWAGISAFSLLRHITLWFYNSIFHARNTFDQLGWIYLGFISNSSWIYNIAHNLLFNKCLSNEFNE